ncbi:thermonuclease family protein [Chelativorans sp.]|uniref:thermonuclease family protein n=1 Tax=Chelativorans sp. TaxID=2203393 RepID=UPI002810B911|nr:thermonuclease family protein [Chelativorans sp.]
MRVRRGNYSRARRSPRAWRGVSDVGLALAILALLALSAARLDQVATRQVAGTAAVNDGDSLTLRGERIRLRGIDAPEHDQDCRVDDRAYDCGARARRALVELAGAGSVTCRGWERDRYGRLLAHCEAGGRDLAEAMVRAGWAVSYGDYAAAEAEAREAGRGLWAGDFDRPRNWREGRRNLQEPPHDWLGRIVNFLRQLVYGTGSV